jgi:hypothetical protein
MDCYQYVFPIRRVRKLLKVKLKVIITGNNQEIGLNMFSSYPVVNSADGAFFWPSLLVSSIQSSICLFTVLSHCLKSSSNFLFVVIKISIPKGILSTICATRGLPLYSSRALAVLIVKDRAWWQIHLQVSGISLFLYPPFVRYWHSKSDRCNRRFCLTLISSNKVGFPQEIPPGLMRLPFSLFCRISIVRSLAIK